MYLLGVLLYKILVISNVVCMLYEDYFKSIHWRDLLKHIVT